MSLKRDAKQLARTAETITRFAEKHGPQVGVVPIPAGPTSFDPDGPACTKAQRIWVREVCKVAARQGVLAEVPELADDLTIGQAEAILTALGSPVGELYKLGRDLGQRKEQNAWHATR